MSGRSLGTQHLSHFNPVTILLVTAILAMFPNVSFSNERPKIGFVFPVKSILDELEPKAPQIPDLPPDIVEEFWAHRRDGLGWTKIAIRLAVLGEFLQRQADPV